MKKALLTLALLLSTSTIFAQDIIKTQTGDILSVKVTEVRQNDVSYIYNNVNMTTSKADIVSITFDNGDQLNFGKKNKNRWYKAEKQRNKRHGGISSTSIMWGSIAGVGVLTMVAALILSL